LGAKIRTSRKGAKPSGGEKRGEKKKEGDAKGERSVLLGTDEKKIDRRAQLKDGRGRRFHRPKKRQTERGNRKGRRERGGGGTHVNAQ